MTRSFIRTPKTIKYHMNAFDFSLIGMRIYAQGVRVHWKTNQLISSQRQYRFKLLNLIFAFRQSIFCHSTMNTLNK